MIIYEAYNLQTKKRYIGLSILSLEQRKKRHYINALKHNHNTYFYNAIRKYGVNNFKWQILGECSSKEELNKAEKECIAFFESNNPIYGYNMTSGGDGFSGICTDEHKRKISSSLKGIKRSKETKEKMSKSKIGIKHSQETKIKISKIQKGKISTFKGHKHTLESKIKISEKKKGKIPSIITREKLRAAALKQWARKKTNEVK